MQIGMGFWPARTLQAAVKMRLFTVLADRAMSGEELCGALKLHPRANPDFFDALLATGMLERDGDGPGGRYRNTRETAAFLDRNSPTYIGGFLEMAHDRLYPFWGDLVEGLQSGEAQNEVKHTGKSVFEAIYSSPEQLEQFIDAMSGVASPSFFALAEKFDFSKYKSLCDVGGSGGDLSRALAKRHQHLNFISADLPAVSAIAERRISAEGLSKRIKAVNLDFFKEDFPKADVITMGNILHDWNLDIKKMLISKAYDALPDGGAFIVIENVIDDARRENAFGMFVSLNMLIETGDGFDYTGADFTRWSKDAGFSRTEVIPLVGPTSAAVAYK